MDIYQTRVCGSRSRASLTPIPALLPLLRNIKLHPRLVEMRHAGIPTWSDRER